MSCRRARRLLEREFDRRLDLDERFLLDAHLEECEACRLEEHVQRVLLEAAESLPAPPVECLDLERSLSAIRAAVEIDRAPLRRRRALPFVLAAAVLLAVAAGALRGLAAHDTGGRDALAGSDPELESPSPIVPDAEAVSDGAAPAPRTELGRSDLERLDRSRERVAAALRDSAPTLRTAGSAAFAQEVDRRLEELRAAGWPVTRLVAGLVRHDGTRAAGGTPDPLAVLALRYLGRRPSRTVHSDLGRALGEPALARTAITALAEAGSEARERLARVAWDGELGAAALGAVANAEDQSPAELVPWIRRAFAEAPPVPRREAAMRLATLLADCGRAGARELLELARHARLDDEVWLDALARSPEARDVLAEVVAQDSRAFAEDDLLRAIERLAPEGVVGWVTERLDDRELRPLALRALAGLEGTEPVLALIESARSRTEPDPDLVRAFVRVLDREPDRALALATAWAAGKLELDGDRLFALLVESRSARSIPALLWIATCGRMDPEERELALLAVEECGDETCRSELLEAVRRMPAEDRYLTARLLIVLRQLCGPEAVRELFAECAPGPRGRALALIDACALEGPTAPALYRLTRLAEHVRTRPTH